MTKYSFKQFCEDINNINLLNLWDYELNQISPDLVNANTKTIHPNSSKNT